MKKFISLTLAIAMFFTLSTTAFAQKFSSNTYSSESNYEYIAEIAANTSLIDDEDLKDTLTTKTLDAIQNSDIKLNIPKTSYNFKNAQLATVSGNQPVTSLTIPVADDSYSVLSNLTLIFGEHNDLISYSEFILTESEQNTFKMQIFSDDIKTYEEVTNLKYIANTEMNTWLSDIQEAYANTGDIQTYGLNVPCFLAVSGAGATVSTLILKLCGAPCVLAPPACAVCLGGIIVVGGGSIIAAVTQCWE